MAIKNLMNRRAALRELEIGESILWAVTASSVTLEMRMFTDAAAKVGIQITQKHMLAVNPKGDELPQMAMIIERTL